VALAFTGYGAYSLDALFGIGGFWTPELIWTTLALGVFGGVANLALRRVPAQSTVVS
jgi:hypothetical protein